VEEQFIWLQSVPEDKFHRSEGNVRLYKACWAEEGLGKVSKWHKIIGPTSIGSERGRQAIPITRPVALHCAIIIITKIPCL